MAKKVTNDLPHNIDAEKAVIGAAFLTKDALLDVINSVDEDDFYEGKHQLIIRAIKNVANADQVVDAVTVTEELINMKELENIGGVEYLKECGDSIVAISSLQYYIDILLKQSALRKMLIAVRNIDEKYRTQEIEDIDDFIAASDNEFKDALNKRKISSFDTTGHVAQIIGEEIAHMQVKDNESLIGLTTGYDNINRLTQGFKKSEMIVVAARPNVGKTALCLNFALRSSIQGRKAVAIFSLEMSKELLVRRLIGCRSYVPLTKIATGNLTGQERSKINNAIQELSEAKIYIDDSSDLRLTDIITKSKKLQASEPNLGLIIIDYLGLVTTPSKARTPDSRQEEVRKISLALKQLARDLDLPIIVVSQLSRDVEKRDTKKPMLSDLRDSGSIEQDADIVMLLYREDYYDKKANPAGNKKGGQLTGQEKYELAKESTAQNLANQIPGNASYVEVNIAKNRNGGTGKCPLFFYRDYGLFDQPSPEWEEAMAKVAKDAEID